MHWVKPAWVGCAKALWGLLRVYATPTLDQDIWWSMRAMANLAAVDHGGQKPLLMGGPAVSNQLCLQLATICRPSADSHEASIIQLLIRRDETSRRRQTDTHASREEGWKALDSFEFPQDVFILCRIQTLPPLSSMWHLNPSPMLSRLDIISPQPSSAIKSASIIPKAEILRKYRLPL